MKLFWFDLNFNLVLKNYFSNDVIIVIIKMYIYVNDVSMVLCIINSIYWFNRIFLYNIIVKIEGYYVIFNKVNVEVLNKIW